MSIQNEIERIKTNIASAYTAVAEKGGALPETQNSGNLTEAVRGIPSGGGGGSIPSGGIIIWSGAADAVPDGWALCDGTNGTPDLRNRFVVGAGAPASEEYFAIMLDEDAVGSVYGDDFNVYFASNASEIVGDDTVVFHYAVDLSCSEYSDVYPDLLTLMVTIYNVGGLAFRAGDALVGDFKVPVSYLDYGGIGLSFTDQLAGNYSHNKKPAFRLWATHEDGTPIDLSAIIEDAQMMEGLFRLDGVTLPRYPTVGETGGKADNYLTRGLTPSTSGDVKIYDQSAAALKWLATPSTDKAGMTVSATIRNNYRILGGISEIPSDVSRIYSVSAGSSYEAEFHYAVMPPYYALAYIMKL